MNFEAYAAAWANGPNYEDQLAHVKVIEPVSAQYASPIEPISPALLSPLLRMGVHRLYSHQAKALDAVRAGRDIITVTATASGKTLTYNVPVLEAILENPKSRALYLFPTKALAQDQLGKLNGFGLFPTVRFATYDGDTAQDERRYIKSAAHIVLTNPDMLHVGILPYHSSWSRFFKELKFIVLDEAHTYRGVFGSNVAQVIRRLKRVCAYHGSNPQFIASSATIANPAELMQKIAGVDPVVIDQDGAASGRRTFVFWNPPVIGQKGERRSTNMEATALFTDLVRHKIRTLVFARSRKSAELILKYSRESFAEASSNLGNRITSYRGGYTSEERRKIEQDLFEGNLIGVATTNALELGVDVGDLDATILTGYPGTIAAAWQQAGRSGRSNSEALSVLVAMDNPLDQYLMRHPDYFFGKPSEHAVLDPNNRRIVSGHMACAAYELPIRDDEVELFGTNALSELEKLVEDGKMVHRAEKWYFRGDGYPASLVSIRSASSETYQIRNMVRGNAVMGTAEGARVYHTLHPGAIYLHQGEGYLVKELDEQNLCAYVSPTDSTYYTEPNDTTSITVLSVKKRKQLGETTAYFGEVVVSNQVLGYRCKQLYSDTVLDQVDLDLPEQVFETEAFWFTVPQNMVLELDENALDLCGAIHAAEHASIGMMPLITTCDRWDIGGVSSPCHFDTGMATVFIYDGYPGGIGLSESTYERLEQLLTATMEMIKDCPCEDGCPSCIQSPKCGNNNEPLDKVGAEYLLEMILGRIESVKTEKTDTTNQTKTKQ